MKAPSGLRVISVARNYMAGSTNQLARSGSLKTLLLAFNYFSGNAPSMDVAPDLGKRKFRNPLGRALSHAGKELSHIPPFLDPYEDKPIAELSNSMWAFPGCSQLTADVCRLNFDTATRFLSADAVRKVSMETFTGYAAMKTLLWVTFPALVLVHNVQSIAGMTFHS